MIEYIAAGSSNKQKVHTSTDVLDLTGDREFLTKDTAEEVLGPLLKDGAAVKRVLLVTRSVNYVVITLQEQGTRGERLFCRRSSSVPKALDRKLLQWLPRPSGSHQPVLQMWICQT